MAISKILHINPHMNSETYHLKTGLNYITKSEKTMNGLYVGAVNCMVENAYECMRTTKEIYGKTDKRQAYHLIISFEEGETNPETAFEIIKEFVNRYLADNYEAVYSVHNDTNHIHGHIIWNSVRFTDGYKYRYEKGDWERHIQPLVDEICEKYGLHTLEQNKAKDDEKEWDVSKNGPFVWNEQIKKDVDECIIVATDFDMFIQMMEEKDYTIKYGKYISVKPKGMERFRRLKTLGENYSEEMIRKRILQKSIAVYKPIDMSKELRIKSYRGHIRKKRLTGLQKQYFAILYKLKKIKKRSYSNSYKYKDDIKKLNILQKQYLFLSNYDIETMEDLEKAQELIKAKIQTTNKAKKILIEENSKREEIFKAVRTIKKEKQAVAFYKLGDKTFEKQNNLVEEAREILKCEELTYKEAEKLEAYYQSLIDECNRTIKKLKKDMRISYGILKDIRYREQKETLRHDVAKQEKITSRHDVAK